MLSSKLIRMVEDHWENIAKRLMRRIRQDPRLRHIHEIPESELLERAREILKNLDHWLSATNTEELTKRYESLGKTRFDEGVPLHELVRSHLLIKDAMIEFLRDQGIAQSPVEFYAEEELEYCTGRFFDNMICSVVKGYEEAVERVWIHEHAHAAPRR
jgi:hypothetical protein